MKRSILLLSCSLLLFAGCHSARKLNAANFKAAIDQYLAKNGKACVPVERPFPIDIPVAQLNDQAGTPAEMAALEKAGLLRSSDTTAVVHSLLDPMRGPTPAQPVRRYELVPNTIQYYQRYPTAMGQMNGFCYGQEQVDSVVKWDIPTTQDGSSFTEVTYTYKFQQLADWAKQPDVEQAFPAIKSTVEEAGTNKVIEVHLTNQGWEAGS